MEELKNVIKSLKNKNFSDFVSGRTLYDLMNNEKYAEMMLNSINTSIIEGNLPEVLKRSVITPLQKVKNSKKINEQRPVNNLPVFDKIIETLVMSRLKVYLDEKNVLIENQHGFRSKHSCETAVLTLIKKWFDLKETRKKNNEEMFVMTLFSPFFFLFTILWISGPSCAFSTKF